MIITVVFAFTMWLTTNNPHTNPLGGVCDGCVVGKYREVFPWLSWETHPRFPPDTTPRNTGTGFWCVGVAGVG